MAVASIRGRMQQRHQHHHHPHPRRPPLRACHHWLICSTRTVSTCPPCYFFFGCCFSSSSSAASTSTWRWSGGDSSNNKNLQIKSRRSILPHLIKGARKVRHCWEPLLPQTPANHRRRQRESQTMHWKRTRKVVGGSPRSSIGCTIEEIWEQEEVRSVSRLKPGWPLSMPRAPSWRLRWVVIAILSFITLFLTLFCFLERHSRGVCSPVPREIVVDSLHRCKGGKWSQWQSGKCYLCGDFCLRPFLFLSKMFVLVIEEIL